MPFVSITRLRVRRWRYVPQFLIQSIRVAWQAKRVAGSLSISVLRVADRAFWTRPVWCAALALWRECRRACHSYVAGVVPCWGIDPKNRIIMKRPEGLRSPICRGLVNDTATAPPGANLFAAHSRDRRCRQRLQTLRGAGRSHQPDRAPVHPRLPGRASGARWAAGLCADLAEPGGPPRLRSGRGA